MVDAEIGVAGQFGLKTRPSDPIGLDAVMVRVGLQIHLRTERKQDLALRVVASLIELLRLADVDALNEAKVGTETFGAIDVLKIGVELPRLPGERSIPGVAAGTGSSAGGGKRVDRLAGHPLGRQDPDGIQLQPGV